MVTPKDNWHGRVEEKEDDKRMVGEPNTVVPKIVTKKSDKFYMLNEKCEDITEDDDISYYKALLMSRLKTQSNGVGLALNQIGINKRMALVNVINPVWLINPKITKGEKPILWKEGCLSFPNKYKICQRFVTVTVTSMQYEGAVVFSGEPSGTPNDNFKERTLESICVQHEIDHLNGKTIYDVTAETKTERNNNNKVGRNDKCPCDSGKKYKRCCL
tara:strand:- start:238 stop:885 length:648 start_codon:yes stop_codon:yes gene_type:complete